MRRPIAETSLVFALTALGCRVTQADALDASARRDVARPPAAPKDAAADVRDAAAVDVPRDAAAPAWVAPEARCTGHTRDRDVVRTAKFCPVRTVGRVTQWAPDAVVVLGGGMLSDGRPNCATVQRGYLAAQLDDALRAAPPTFVFSGAGNDSRALAAMDEADARCVAARIRQSAATGSAAQRQRLAREADGVAAGRSWVMTEADAMCAVMLRRTEPARRDEVLARVRFEPRATTTVQNALFTRPMLVAGHFQRVLVLTSPVLKRFGRGVDLHADRAFGGFQALRRGGPWALAAVGCPIVMGAGVQTWFQFEPTSTMPEGMVMEVARR
jgi:hypothetical protein